MFRVTQPRAEEPSASQPGTQEQTVKVRKREQNRIAQRTYRQNQKSRIQALEEAVRQMNGVAPRGHDRQPPRGNGTKDDAQNLNGGDDFANILSDFPPSPSSPQESEQPLACNAEMMALDIFRPMTGRTALHRAACKNNESMARLLLDQGAEISKQDTTGQTELHLAVSNGSEAVVRILLDRRADPNLKDSLDRTSLFQAVQGDNLHITKLLLDALVDINSKDVFGETALHLAVEHGFEGMTLLLLSYGADINA